MLHPRHSIFVLSKLLLPCAFRGHAPPFSPSAHLTIRSLSLCIRPQKIAQTDIEKRLNVWIDEVTNASRHTSFDPGKSWWPLQGNRSKLTGKLARAVGVEDQIGLTANQMQASELGRQWKRKVQDFLGARVHLWTMWDNVFISVAGKNDPEEPTEDNVVTNPSSSTVRSLKAKITAEVPIAAIPAPSAMAQRAAAKAVGKLNRAEMQKYQKGIDAGRLNEKEYDAALGHIRSGAIMPSEVMLKTAYSVLKGAERDGIAELAIPRLVSPRNGAVVNTHLKVAMLPPGKVNETVKSSYERSLALLKSILEGMYPSTEAKYNALKRLANDYGFAFIDRLRTMTMPETIAFKRFCRLSGNQAGKTSRFLRHLGILDRLLPRREDITKFEEDRQHPVVVEKMRLFISAADKDAGGGGSTEECITWHVEQPTRILEDLVCVSKLSNTFEDSKDISNHDGSILVFMGADKAGEDTTAMIRIGNRRGGNHGVASQPIARTEDGAAESHPNCIKFFYSSDEKYPMRPFQQHLIDCKLHMIVVAVYGPGDKMLNCRAMTVELAGLPVDETAIVDLDDDAVEFANAPADENGDQWSKTKAGVFKIAVNGDGNAIGLVHFEEQAKLIGWRNNIDTPMDVTVGEVRIECFRLRGFLSQDTKHGLIVAGIGHCASSCSCLHCVRAKNEFKFLPSWMKELDPSIPAHMVEKEAPVLRIGDKANSVLHQKYKDELKDSSAQRSATKHLELKKKCGSVVLEPGLDTHLNDLMAPMHIPQGLLTHNSTNIRGKIRDAEKKNPWMDHVHDVKAEVEASIADLNSDHHKNAHSNVMRLERTLEEKRKYLADAEASNNAAQIAYYFEEVANLEAQLDGFINEGQYSATEKKLHGAKDMKELISNYLKKTSKKPHGRAEYRYNRAFQLLAKVCFRAEHSGFELSNADGIKALEKWDEICKYTADSWSAESEDATERGIAQQIIGIMEESKKVAAPMLPISKILKSQEKLDDAKIEEISLEIIKLAKAWREVYKTFLDDDDSKGVFLKLHHLEHHVRPFMIKHGFYGLGSEEGFEQAHNEFDSDMKIVSRMPCPVNRVNAFVRRQNSACDPDIIPILMGMEGKKRGAYQPSAKRKRRRINTVQNSSVQEAEEDGYLLAKDTKANRTYLIKEGWKDVYLMCACGVPPDSWKEDLTEDP